MRIIVGNYTDENGLVQASAAENLLVDAVAQLENEPGVHWCGWYHRHGETKEYLLGPYKGPDPAFIRSSIDDPLFAWASHGTSLSDQGQGLKSFEGADDVLSVHSFFSGALVMLIHFSSPNDPVKEVNGRVQKELWSLINRQVFRLNFLPPDFDS